MSPPNGVTYLLARDKILEKVYKFIYLARSQRCLTLVSKDIRKHGIKSLKACYKTSSYVLVLIYSLNSFSQIEIFQINFRFAWIKVPAKYVTARLSKPIDGLSICWFEVNTPKIKFDFITRRAVPYEECMYKVLRGRYIINKGGVLEIIGSAASKDKANEYSAFWETVEGKSGCVSYFGDKCEDKAKLIDELSDWKNKAIDPKIYP